MSFNEAMKMINYIFSLDDTLKEYLALAGGIVPYVISGNRSKRNHGDIDIICHINNIDKVRDIFKNNNLYDSEMDSKTYFDKDFGFRIIVDGVKIGIYPYDYINCQVHQYSYDEVGKKCKEKIVDINVNAYVERRSKYKTMNLEVLLKSKIMAYRDIDKYDIDEICKFGFNEFEYAKLSITSKDV